MSEKLYLTGQSLLEDSYRLAEKVLLSGFRPTFMIAVWRGGAPMGIAVQEYLAYHGIETDNISIRTASYAAGIDQQAKTVQVFGLNYLVKNIRHEDSLLIVDDVFDTGKSIDAIINELSRRARLNTPHDIRVAVPYYKPERNKTDRVPDYYIHETSSWLKYPHSLEGLSAAEIEQGRPELFEIIKNHLPAE
ncbi:MAG: hypoxanthine phosphoribosyltransferase [Saccharospirillaceae bacterium]|nr:hypoxanthine phosphoribosyltransferase [Thalassolituus sp. HI0120]KZZ46296.1 hypoxanthine phosphoribosyltransferase [Thalassolituus sp. HI0120]MCH2040427.1 hypoxanthine phosphoribosyltransferase [Saccharospirillaceae bacterium]